MLVLVSRNFEMLQHLIFPNKGLQGVVAVVEVVEVVVIVETCLWDDESLWLSKDSDHQKICCLAGLGETRRYNRGKRQLNFEGGMDVSCCTVFHCHGVICFSCLGSAITNGHNRFYEAYLIDQNMLICWFL